MAKTGKVSNDSTLPEAKADKEDTALIAVYFPVSVIERIEEYRWANTKEGKAAAVRALVEIGLQHI